MEHKPQLESIQKRSIKERKKETEKKQQVYNEIVDKERRFLSHQKGADTEGTKRYENLQEFEKNKDSHLLNLYGKHLQEEEELLGRAQKQNNQEDIAMHQRNIVMLKEKIEIILDQGEILSQDDKKYQDYSRERLLASPNSIEDFSSGGESMISSSESSSDEYHARKEQKEEIFGKRKKLPSGEKGEDDGMRSQRERELAEMYDRKYGNFKGVPEDVNLLPTSIRKQKASFLKNSEDQEEYNRLLETHENLLKKYEEHKEPHIFGLIKATESSISKMVNMELVEDTKKQEQEQKDTYSPAEIRLMEKCSYYISKSKEERMASPFPCYANGAKISNPSIKILGEELAKFRREKPFEFAETKVAMGDWKKAKIDFQEYFVKDRQTNSPDKEWLAPLEKNIFLASKQDPNLFLKNENGEFYFFIKNDEDGKPITKIDSKGRVEHLIILCLKKPTSFQKHFGSSNTNRSKKQLK